MNCGGDTEDCGSAWIGLLWNNVTNSYSWSDGTSLGYTNVDHSSRFFRIYTSGFSANFCNDGFFGEHFFMSWNKMWYNCPYSSYNGHIHGVVCERWIVKRNLLGCCCMIKIDFSPASKYDYID